MRFVEPILALCNMQTFTFFSSPLRCLLLGNLLLLLALSACDNDKPAPKPELALFSATPAVKPVTPIINEVSGIADSKINPGKLWAHEDSGRPLKLHLLNHDGTVIKKIHLKGTNNRDWEDMALAGSDIFIGDIGDNNRAYADYSFYQFPEPSAAVDTVKDSKRIRFKYPDGSRDAEAFLIDPVTKDIYIITKQDDPARIYKLTSPYDYNSVNAATLVGTLKYTGIVSAALAPDGKEILLKTYTSIYHYPLKAGETIPAALQQTFTQIPYQTEPQGEAIGFAADNSGFFTLSEKGLATEVQLYFYKRN